MFLFGEFRIMTRRQFNVISMKRIAIFPVFRNGVTQTEV